MERALVAFALVAAIITGAVHLDLIALPELRSASPPRPDPTRAAVVRLAAALDSGVNIRDLREHRTEIDTQARLAGKREKVAFLMLRLDGVIDAWEALVHNLACRGGDFGERDEGQLARCESAVRSAFRMADATPRLERRRNVAWEVAPLLSALAKEVEQTQANLAR